MTTGLAAAAVEADGVGIERLPLEWNILPGITAPQLLPHAIGLRSTTSAAPYT